MDIQVKTNTGVSGKTITLSIAELIVLSKLKDELNTVETIINDDDISTSENIETINETLNKAIGFLSNITDDVVLLDDVKLLDDATTELFMFIKIKKIKEDAFKNIQAIGRIKRKTDKVDEI